MGGLIQNAQQPAAVPMQQAAPGQQPDDETTEAAPDNESAEGEQSAHPDQQAYERVVTAATKVLYDPQHGQEILNILQHAQSPAQGLADATYMLMGELIQISKGTMPTSVIVPAGKEVMSLIAEMAEKAGIAESPQIMQQAMLIIAQKLAQRAGMSPQQIQQAIAQRAQAQPQQAPAFQPLMSR